MLLCLLIDMMKYKKVHNACTRLSSLDSINNLFDDWIDIFGRNDFEGRTFAPITPLAK